MTSGNQGDLTFLLLLLPLGLAITMVNALSVLDESSRGPHPLAWWKPAVWEGSSFLVIGVMAPFVIAFTRRAWPLARPRWRAILLHVPAVLLFAAIHVIVVGVLRWAAFVAMGDYYSPISPLLDFVYEFRKDALVYVGMVLLYVMWRLYRAQQVQAPVAGLDAIEVRDGARRRFVPLVEVAWIEAAGNYVELHQGLTPILHRAPLSEMERQLEGVGFIRIHRSRLVRRAAIAQVESKPSGDYVVRLTDGRELAGSRRYRRPLLEP